MGQEIKAEWYQIFKEWVNSMTPNADLRTLLFSLFLTIVFLFAFSFVPSFKYRIILIVAILLVIWPLTIYRVTRLPNPELQLASVGVRNDAQELIFEIKSNKTRKSVSTDRVIRVGIFEENKINWYIASGEQVIEPGSTVQFSVRCPISKQMFVMLAVENKSLKDGISVDYEHIAFTWETWKAYSWWPYKSAFTYDVNERISRLRDKLRVCISLHQEGQNYSECFK